MIPSLRLLLSASPYSRSSQRESIFHLTRSISSPSLALTLNKSSFAKSIHFVLGPSFSFPSTWHRYLPSSFFPRSLLLSSLRVHTSVALNSEVCLLASQFSQSLSRIRFYLVLSCHSQRPSHHFQLCNFHFSHLSFRHCHSFHSIKHGCSNNTTTLLYILSLTLADNFLSHRTPDIFFHPTHLSCLDSFPHFFFTSSIATNCQTQVFKVFRSLYLFSLQL